VFSGGVGAAGRGGAEAKAVAQQGLDAGGGRSAGAVDLTRSEPIATQSPTRNINNITI
jgi:hypothetical protein